MKKIKTRFTALLLVALMLVSVFPFGVLTTKVHAEDLADMNGMGKLGHTFNMLSENDREAYIETAHKKPIFHADVYANPGKYMSQSDPYFRASFDGLGISRYECTYITSMSEYFSKFAASLATSGGVSTELDVEAGVKFLGEMVSVGLSTKVKYNLETSLSGSAGSSSGSSHSEEHVIVDYIWEYGTYSLNLSNTNQVKRLWAQDANNAFLILHPDFVDSLLTDDPVDLFEVYGTHMITQYTAGGNAYSSYSGNFDSVSATLDWTQNVSFSLEDGLSGLVTLKNSLDEQTSGGDSENESEGFKQVSGSAIGAYTTDFEWTEKGAEEVKNETHRNAATTLMNDKLRLMPIWKLLVGEEYAERRLELEQYFYDHVSEEYAELYEEYLCEPQDKVNFTGYTQIRTAEDFKRIGNDLGGKYVLVNDIDLGGNEWTPIGTKEAPFRGVLDGNGYTVKGLKITKLTGGVAGLLGYNSGTVKNLCVEGTIEIEDDGHAPEELAYLGGIVGYNSGTVLNCRSKASVNGKIGFAGDGEFSTVNETWFDSHAEATEAAKKNAESKPLSDETTVPVKDTPVRLSGTATNVTVEISPSTLPAYIILENASFTGKFFVIGDAPREICIISTGEANTVSGVKDFATLSFPNSSLYLCGDAPLTLNGYHGADGADGQDGDAGDHGGTAQNGTDGRDGERGSNGENGQSAICARLLYVNVASDIVLQGGNGGDGGDGGNGGNGGNGGEGYYKGFTWKTPGNGAGGGNGGDGGDGGIGAVAVKADEMVLQGGVCYVRGGCSGRGGNGGDGGNGGRGGDAATGTVHDGANGGGGGNGGDGGDIPLPAQAFSDLNENEEETTVTVNNDAILLAVRGSNNDAEALKGGSNGTGGGGGSARPAGGSNGHSGGSGTPGEQGTKEDFEDAKVAYFQTAAKIYSLFAESLTYKDANEKAEAEAEKLVSIGSQNEQELIASLRSFAGEEDKTFWIGLERYADSGVGYDCFEWADGAVIKVKGTGASAETVRMDGEAKKERGEAYANFADGQPDDADGLEDYVYLGADGRWYDATASATAYGYITEKGLNATSTNSPKKNALFVGGVVGYNGGNVESACNEGSVNAYAHAERSGVSAYAGGIAGYNGDMIKSSWNCEDAVVESIAQSQSLYFYADAYAKSIAQGDATVEASVGRATASAFAYSANGLSNEDGEAGDTGEKTEAESKIDTYWKNSALAVEVEAEVSYFPGDSFRKDSVTVTYGGERIDAYTARYNLYTPGMATVVIVYERDGESYKRYLPVTVEEPEIDKVEWYRLPNQAYTEGDAFDPSGIAVKVLYKHGGFKIHYLSDLFCGSVPDMTRLGKQEVVFEHLEMGYALSYEINVAPKMPGDMDGDGVLSLADVVALRRYLAGGYDIDLATEAADLNGDGAADMLDVDILRKKIVGGYGEK